MDSQRSLRHFVMALGCGLLRGGQIVFDKQVDGTSVDELTKLVIEEYRLEPAAP